jgi:putative peptidoglycan lipid II flippase
MSRLTKITLLLASFFAVDKVLAITRQLLTARIFGLSAELDAFNAANNLPDLLFALISGGALAIAFIPVLSEVLTNSGKKPTWLLFSRIANLAFIVTAVIGIFIAIFAEPLVSWRLGIAPGFNLTQQKLVAELMRLNLIATLIFSISGLVMAGLQTNQHFLLPAIAPLLYNLGQIFGAIILAPKEGFSVGPIQLPAYNMGVHGLVYGVIIGAALHLLIQIPALIRYQFKWTPSVTFLDPSVRKVLKLLGPRLLTMLFIQLIFIARDNLASGLSTGAVSALTYGWMVMQVPETLLGTAIGTALLPTLSEFAVKQQWDEFTKVISRAVRILTALTIPIFVILSLGLRPLISLAFGFDAVGTDLILNVSRAFLFGLIAHSIIEVGARSFYSIQNAKIPLLASAVTIITFLIFGNLLVNRFGAVGIAASVTIAFSVEMLLIMILLIRRFHFNVGIVPTLSRTIPASIAGTAVIIGISLWIPINPVFSALISMGTAVSVAFFIIKKDIKELRNL